MLLPQVCDRLVIEAEPRISIDALIDLRALIDAQRLKNTSNRLLKKGGRRQFDLFPNLLLEALYSIRKSARVGGYKR